MQSVFITGTDTGVGKTLLSAALLHAARARGIDAVPMKPIQTGCLSGDSGLVPPDLDYVLSVNRLEPEPGDRERMCPYRFEPACSPHLAAELANERIDVGHISGCFRHLAQRHEAVLVEGAGGLLVPVDRSATMLDLVVELALPVILVARSGLGTLNHSLLSIRELRRAKLTVAAVVLVRSEPDPPGYIEEDNARTIAQFGHVPVLGPVPYSDACASGNPEIEELLNAFGETAAKLLNVVV